MRAYTHVLYYYSYGAPRCLLSNRVMTRANVAAHDLFRADHCALSVNNCRSTTQGSRALEIFVQVHGHTGIIAEMKIYVNMRNNCSGLGRSV